MTRTQIFLAVFFAVFSPAGLRGEEPSLQSAEWKLYFHSQADTKDYINTASIVRLPNGNVRAWTRHLNKEAKGNVSLVEINCAERLYTIRRMEPFGITGDQYIKDLKMYGELAEHWSTPEQQWEYLAATDSQEAQYNTWCKNKPKKKISAKAP